MDSLRKCADCGMPAPRTDTAHTLISSAHGWRLTRAVDANGQAVVEWRCPTCWRAYKRARTGGGAGGVGGTR